MDYKDSTWNIPIRVKLIGEFGPNMPEIAKIILEYYNAQADRDNRSKLFLNVDGLPPSTNHMYDRIGYRKKGGGSGVITKRSAELETFRLIVQQALVFNRYSWKPTGPTAAVLFFETPHWVTKEHKVRKMDSDNRVKPMFDSIEYGAGTPDELYWQFMVFKILSKRTRTSIYLFDLGDVVEHYY
jgi:Holliday junction resolvase RusA-like endonuclease